MKRLSRDSWLALLLVVLFVGVTAVAIYQETMAAQQAPPLASFSSRSDGARALWLYLEQMGFAVRNPTQDNFTIAADDDVLLMLSPQTAVLPAEWRAIEGWVAQGGTLILAGDDFFSNQAFDHLGFRVSYTGGTETAVIPQTPLMDEPPLPADAALTTTYALQSNRDDFVTHFATANGRPVVVSWAQGDGRIILSANPAPFSNLGLQDPANAAWVLALLNAAGDPQVIFFDEWHHGVRGTAVAVTAGNWLQRTPGGRALLYVALVLFGGLLLQGRIFGRPLPMPQTLNRRAPLEYISGIANLSRRAGHRTAVLQDYRLRLKRDLGFRYRLNPTLPDEEFVARLAELDTAVDPQSLRAILHQLQTARTEQEMVQAAAAATAVSREP
ncbi:MAG TPA: DUF4350 domain-containing protein [Chloroflexota bacterium]|nr:DUF4350 domain-containing protein [Chloroflexota bacterium]HUM68007.1 DUF4350 domain-containing protein [Chloroflexota bacterium]